MKSLNRVIGTLALLIWGLTLGASPAAAQVPKSRHVFIVFGENNPFSSTYNSGQMPYLDSLANKYGLATNYVADTGPSIGNYLTWASGQVLSNNDSTNQTWNSCSPSSVNVGTDNTSQCVDNIGLDMQNAGLTWRAYEENYGSGCGGLASGGYAKKHDPLAYFNGINQAANHVCFSQFATDLKNNTLPALSYLGPNL